MGYVAANRRERKRVSRHARMRAQPTGFYRKQRLSTLVGLAKKEGLVSGDLPLCAFPDHPKELIGVMRRHFRQVHYKKNTVNVNSRACSACLCRALTHPRNLPFPLRVLPCLHFIS